MSKLILKNGFKTVYSNAYNPNVRVASKTTKLPGFTMGGGIDTTTNDNNAYRTMAARALAALTNGTQQVAFDSEAIGDIMDLKGRNCLWTATLPNGSHLDFYGFMDSFEPTGMTEGSQPIADMVIIVTNEDGNGNESAPTYHSGGGTTTTTTAALITTTTAAPAP